MTSGKIKKKVRVYKYQGEYRNLTFFERIKSKLSLEIGSVIVFLTILSFILVLA